jgi:mannose-6-phosphate isomerase
MTEHTASAPGGTALAWAVAAFRASPRPLRLTGAIQSYAWGGYDFLADLTGAPRSPAAPRAELWLGAHPTAPATAWLDGLGVPLDRLVAEAPDAVLGRRSIERFGPTLPYLLKVLDVRAMLSIQAHPTLEQARAGFARENAAGIPLDAPHRNYRDASHKPEAQVALGDFWLLCGFRPADEIAALLAARPGLDALPAAVPRHGLDETAWRRALYEHLMRLPQPRIDQLLSPWLSTIGPHYADGTLSPQDPDFWAARAAADFARADGSRDRGIASVWLLNLVHVPPGSGLALGAGVLHAYLAGQAVEIMASSDNVLRGGLTPKHVDVDELLRILRFDRDEPRLSAGTPISAVAREYPSLAEEFVLRRVTLPAGAAVDSRPTSCETLIVLDGDVDLTTPTTRLGLRRGASAIVPAGVPYQLVPATDATVFVAAVP